MDRSPAAAHAAVGDRPLCRLLPPGRRHDRLCERDVSRRSVTTALLLAVAGFLVAGILAYAGLYRVRDQQTVIAPLYAADLLGGCLGSLLGSLVLIPLFGLDGAVMGMILLAALCLVLI